MDDLHPHVQLRRGIFRKLRKERGRAAKDIAEAAQITRDYLYKLERGSAPRCSPETFGRLAEALGLDDEERRQLIATDSADGSAA